MDNAAWVGPTEYMNETGDVFPQEISRLMDAPTSLFEKNETQWSSDRFPSRNPPLTRTKVSTNSGCPVPFERNTFLLVLVYTLRTALLSGHVAGRAGTVLKPTSRLGPSFCDLRKSFERPVGILTWGDDPLVILFFFSPLPDTLFSGVVTSLPGTKSGVFAYTRPRWAARQVLPYGAYHCRPS